MTGTGLNSVAEFVYRVAAKNDRRRLFWSIAGALFWYGAVAIMIWLAPIVDRAMGIRMLIPLVVRLPLGIILLLIGVPTVCWMIIRFVRTKGSPIPFNPPPALVVNGLYRFVRNPMHLGWTVLLIGVAVLMQSFTLLVIFIPLFVMVHIIYLKLVEEKELEKKFGQAYIDYKKKVPMFFPRVKGK
ncbi:MAG: isoprenylcysteine carboxylmethyltransferase family protein [Dehalococcoidales bacterium]